MPAPSSSHTASADVASFRRTLSREGSIPARRASYASGCHLDERLSHNGSTGTGCNNASGLLCCGPPPQASGSLAGRRSPKASLVPRLSISLRDRTTGAALHDITNVIPGRSLHQEVLASAKPERPSMRPKQASGQGKATKRSSSITSGAGAERPVSSSSSRHSLPGGTTRQEAAAAAASVVNTGSSAATSAAPEQREREQPLLAAAAGAAHATAAANGMNSAAVSSAAPALEPVVTPRALASSAGDTTAASAIRNPFAGVEDDTLRSVSEYIPEVVDLLFQDEATCLVRAGFMEVQQAINGKMRAILVDWLVEVHMKYKLRPETLWLTVNIIDRYLALAQVARKRLQLVGVSAMFIASKFEDVRPPQANDFVYITDNAYTKQEVLHMECAILSALDFKVVVPTVAQFLEFFQQANNASKLEREASKFLAELSLPEYRLAHWRPSTLAAAAVLLGNELMGRSPVWSAELRGVCRQNENVLRDCAEELRRALAASPGGSLQAVRKKYSLMSRQQVARLPAFQLQPPAAAAAGGA
eukprot:TRINITY_DN20529_c0_g1_i1.p1 TRINITY_DN20529_c0_g1~~TRINITY_DN20529_c0_g1_i1.p1  ORF type:complete len:533 (-),score=140.08 TRINITY_DN20529_c0_g1_i1:101-1699(-)